MSADSNSSKNNETQTDSRVEDRLDHHLRKMALILGWMLISAGVLWALIRLFPIVRWTIGAISPFLIALVVAYIFNPIVNLVQRRFKLGRIGGIIFVLCILASFALFFLGLLLPILYIQGLNVVTAVHNTAPRIIESVSTSLVGMTDQLTEEDIRIYTREARDFLEPLGTIIQDAPTTLTALDDAPTSATRKFGVNAIEFLKQLDMAALTQKASSATPGFLGGVYGVIRGLLAGVSAFLATAILAVVIAFYYLLEFDSIPSVIRLLLPDNIEERVMDVLIKMDIAVGGFLRGQLIVCSLVGLLAAIGLSCIGMYKYAILVGFVAGAANFIPYLGPVMGAAPALLWAFCSHTNITWGQRFFDAGLVVGLFALIQVIDGFIFQPRILGKSSNLHPLAVMAALVIGGQFGFAGMIVAVPLACVTRVLLREFWWTPRVVEKAVQATEAARTKSHLKDLT